MDAFEKELNEVKLDFLEEEEKSNKKEFVLEKEIVGVDGTVKKINELLDFEKDIYEESGNVIIKHNGVNKLRKFVGAEWKPITTIDTPNNFNDGSYIFECTVVFPKGEKSVNIGVASNNNTYGFSRKQKPYMAHKRGYDRAFLRSNTIGLFDILSEEEMDELKEKRDVLKEKLKNEVKEELLNEFEIWKKNEENKKDLLLTLPNEDPKYPNTHIIKILTDFKDVDYLFEIIEKYSDKKELISEALYWKHRIEKKREKEREREREKEVVSQEKKEVVPEEEPKKRRGRPRKNQN